jgi:ubiquinone/menaquinone biosynthesis C-methylase UbiE
MNGIEMHEAELKNIGPAARAWRRLVRFGFRLLYNELAWSYDGVSWFVSLGQWRDWQRAALPFLRGNTVLELAHGPGHMLLALEQAGFKVVGLDLSPRMAGIAAKRLRRAGKSIPLVRGRAQALPFAAASFDSVLATFPTEFIDDPATLASLWQALGPGGRIVIVPGARLTGNGPLQAFIEWLYAITGQRQHSGAAAEQAHEWHETSNGYQALGFRVWGETVELDASQVTIIIAERADGW